MSASIKEILGKNGLVKENSQGQVIQLPRGETSRIETFSPLPKIGIELEAFISAAKQNEAALVEEQIQSRKAKEEIQALQQKCNALETELNTARRELSLWEDHLKAQIAAFRERDQAAQDRLKQNSRRMEELLKRDAEFKHRFQDEQMKAKSFEQLAEDLKRKNDSWQKAYQQLDLTVQRLKAELEQNGTQMKQLEASSAQSADLDRKVRSLTQESKQTTDHLQKTTEDLVLEKRHREKLEELLSKERREKEIALTCLQTTEAKLKIVSKELEELQKKEHRPSSSIDSGIRLEF